ncbi:MAG: glycosyltransferase family 2 protein [Fibrobacterota bacterium]|nr:glycosyltransferase family 2 protein [Fibrobacterota bacterium]
MDCILINYRNPDDTIACIASLAASKAEGFRILLVNNHAADGSEAPLRAALKVSGMEYVYLDPGGNIGFTGGVNLGFAKALEAGAAHVMLLNNDTVVASDFAAHVREALERHPRDVLAGRILEFDTGEVSWNIGRFSRWTGQVIHVFDADYAGEVEFVSGGLMIVPGEVWRRLGGFDDRYFMYCEDVDFCIRLKRAGIRIRYCPAISIRHKTSSSTKRSGTPKEYYRIRNQTHIVLNRGRTGQKALYLGFLFLMMFYKLARRPALFSQAFRGALHGLSGRLGKWEG